MNWVKTKLEKRERPDCASCRAEFVPPPPKTKAVKEGQKGQGAESSQTPAPSNPNAIGFEAESPRPEDPQDAIRRDLARVATSDPWAPPAANEGDLNILSRDAAGNSVGPAQ